MAKREVEFTILPPTTRDMNKIVPNDMFEKLTFWGKLNTNQKAVVQEEGHALAAAQLTHIKSGIVIGEHLMNVRETLKPYNGAFSQFLRAFGFKGERQCYRLIEAYEVAIKKFPQSILDVASARGVRLLGASNISDRPFGAYTEAVEILPPPKKADFEEATRYMDQLEQTYKERKKIAKEKGVKVVRPNFEPTKDNKQDWLQQMVRNFRAYFHRLPSGRSSRDRKEFTREFIGMILTEAGMSTGAGINAVAVPEEFQTGRGRPKTNVQAASA